MQFQFNAKKSAQAASVLLKLNGGDIDKYLFIKMLYLADREALNRWQEPITGDSAASMQYGPVLSTIYDLTKGDCPSQRKEWEPFISNADQETNRIFLREDPGLDELSRAEIAILRSIFEQFGGYTWKQMRDFCHHSLPEFEEVGDTSKPLSVNRILTAIGKTEEEIREAAERHRGIQMAELLLVEP